jgi:hypothetical protein
MTKPVTGEVNAALFNERNRISEILESPEGKRNPEMAATLALRTSLDVDTARDLLAKAPAANPYLAAMDREGVVGLNSATADFSAPDPKAAREQEIKENMALFNNMRRRDDRRPVGIGQ